MSISDIIKRLMENHRLDEMSISRGEALATCIELGTEFYEHFHKVFVGGTKDRDFKHHCSEMQGWYNSVKKIVLSYNKKTLSKDQLYRWFFLAGSETYVTFNDEREAAMYDQFVKIVLEGDERLFSDILEEIFSKRDSDEDTLKDKIRKKQK